MLLIRVGRPLLLLLLLLLLTVAPLAVCDRLAWFWQMSIKLPLLLLHVACWNRAVVSSLLLLLLLLPCRCCHGE